MICARHMSGIAVVLLSILFVRPASAGWFGGSDPVPVTPDAATVAEIQRALEDERYMDAGALLDKALTGDESNPKLLLLAGELSLARSHPEQAVTYFKSVETDADVRAAALEGEGISLAALGRGNEAVPVLEKAVAEDASAWKAWNALGVEYDLRRDWQKAEIAFGHAVTASGGAPIVLNNRGFSRLSQDRIPEAIQDFVSALQKKPDMAGARNNLRLAIALNGDFQKAVSAARPDERAAVFNNAGYVAMLRGDYAVAKDMFEQAIKAKGEYYAVAAQNLEMAKSLEAQNGATAQNRNAAHQ